jgi:hypothetical protein
LITLRASRIYAKEGQRPYHAFDILNPIIEVMPHDRRISLERRQPVHLVAGIAVGNGSECVDAQLSLFGDAQNY